MSSSCNIISQHIFYLQDEKAQSLTTQVKILTVSVLKNYFILIFLTFYLIYRILSHDQRFYLIFKHTVSVL